MPYTIFEEGRDKRRYAGSCGASDDPGIKLTSRYYLLPTHLLRMRRKTQ